MVQQLKNITQQNLFYWRSKGGQAELDFICEVKDYVCPLEVKAGVNPRSKSITSYDQQFNPSFLARTTLLNFKKDAKICNIPLYSIQLFFSLVSDQKSVPIRIGYCTCSTPLMTASIRL